ncbi:hypothetical protein [Chitinophaga caseinilytica]|uniref:Gingipain domain-containing protein n=1 Tax=Chitinophaga caseinilytica TaxID=2267521 RepID=A0ABZ2ZBX2_9BACT
MKKDKIIVSNRKALEKKYGAKLPAFLQDLEDLKAGDKARGLSTEIVFVDDVKTMKTCKVTAVKNEADARQNKRAIDGLYKHFQPDYILIAGAQDVIPFQPLKNLIHSQDDEDAIVPSDLPYACDKPWSDEPGKFVNPSRVVGRLPDLPGGKDPKYFHSLVRDAITSKPGNQKDYLNYLAISVYEWRLSTEESVQNIFGNTEKLHLSPTKGPRWTPAQLKAKTHFINCHGALEDGNYYGQKGSSYPISHTSGWLEKKIAKGTVVAAECCYGAQLYDPGLTDSGYPSIASQYLLQHAVAVAGSSTIAYGPTEGQGLADLITQYFLINVLRGASTGRAFLEARQRFLDEMGPTLDPYEIKTLSQFYLLGDPSLVPVNVPTKLRDARENRREGMQAKGVMLGQYLSVPKALPGKEEPANIKALVKAHKFPGKTTKKVFVMEGGPAPLARGLQSKGLAAPVKFHVYSASKFHGKFKETNVLVIKERAGQILGERTYVRR